MTPPINDTSRQSPRVIIEEKHGCWPFRRVRKHRTTEMSDLARRTLRPQPHPSYNDPVVVIHDATALRRSQGCENIATLAQKLEQGTLFTDEDLAEAKRIQEGNY